MSDHIISPGPWHVSSNEGFTCIRDADGHIVTEITYVNDANALLIGAAREMVAALKAIKLDVIAESGKVMPSRILQMQAAIAKAEGRDHE